MTLDRPGWRGRRGDSGEAAFWAFRAAGRGVVEFYNSSNLTFASSIAYCALLSFFPFVLLLLMLLGRLAIGMNNETLVQLVIRALPSHFDFVIDQIEELSKAPTGRGIVGTVVLFWASMGFFGAITSAVNHAWGVEKPLGFFKHKLIAAIMLVIAASVDGRGAGDRRRCPGGRNAVVCRRARILSGPDDVAGHFSSATRRRRCSS